MFRSATHPMALTVLSVLLLVALATATSAAGDDQSATPIGESPDARDGRLCACFENAYVVHSLPVDPPLPPGPAPPPPSVPRPPAPPVPDPSAAWSLPLLEFPYPTGEGLVPFRRGVDVPAGTYRRVRFRYHVLVDELPEKRGFYNWGWFTLRKSDGEPSNRLMLAYVLLKHRGPTSEGYKTLTILRTGLGPDHQGKTRKTRALSVPAGSWLQVDLEFDLAADRVRLRISGAGLDGWELDSPTKNEPPISVLDLSRGVFVELGFPDPRSSKNEYPFSGAFTNLLMEVYP